VVDSYISALKCVEVKPDTVRHEALAEAVRKINHRPRAIERLMKSSTQAKVVHLQLEFTFFNNEKGKRPTAVPLKDLKEA